MTIDFKCPSCGALIHAPSAAQGRTGTCNKCHAKLKVPIQPTTSPSPQPTVQPRDPTPPPPVSPSQSPPPLPNASPASRVTPAPIDNPFVVGKTSPQSISPPPKRGFDPKSIILQVVLGLVLAFSSIGLLGSIAAIFGGQYAYDKARVEYLTLNPLGEQQMRNAQIMRAFGYVGVVLCLGGIATSFFATHDLVKRKKIEAEQNGTL